MDNSIIRNNSAKDQIINEIVRIEQEMFNRVQGINGRTNCQDNHDTFYIMRFSQNSALREETIRSYLEDLKLARSEFRNIITEKYGYMMEYTEPEYFEKNLKNRLPSISPEKENLVNEIATILVKEHADFAARYPMFSRHGRQVVGGQGTSSSIYLKGELKTFSIKTLKLYLDDIGLNRTSGTPTVDMIFNVTVSFYGYKSVRDAEIALVGKR